MTELLAPAGNLECLYAAFNAGADAVYLAGEKFGARAYAGNFSKEELLLAIQIAHVLKKRIYLTINTLMKEVDLTTLDDFLRPFYEVGLDGVIVQDIGALAFMQKHFPGLELHASTQMTITGANGANYLKKFGVCRVVPARELSLEEIIDLKKKTKLEVECFVHGAMCYSYSGQCLFSSMLGTRSGNRGRCAGPCRLPYDAYYDDSKINKNGELFQLGLKDLNTLEILPKLLDAGIDSFKIEGRMKSPSYVYFVTSLYRKYMDLYLENPKAYRISKDDIEKLKAFYSRGELQSGYYMQHNGRNMITLSASGYQSKEEVQSKEKEAIFSKHIIEQKKRKVDAYFQAYPNTPLSFTLISDACSVTVTGIVPDLATSRSATKEDVYKQLNKTGNTLFSFDTLEVELDDGLFLPNKILNDLRRDALELLQQQILEECQRNGNSSEGTIENKIEDEHPSFNNTATKFQICIRTNEQLNGFITFWDGFSRKQKDTSSIIKRIYLSYDLFVFEAKLTNRNLSLLKKLRQANFDLFLRMPAIARKAVMTQVQDKTFDDLLEFMDGVCVNNLELFGYFQTKYPNLPIVADSRFYMFQSQTAKLFSMQNVQDVMVSYELHKSEIKKLIQDTQNMAICYIMPVYGRIPMMETANCILKTNTGCRKLEEKKNAYYLDRYQKKIPVIFHCDRCENTIYNSVVFSLHKEFETVKQLGVSAYLLDFTIENEKEMKDVLAYYFELFSDDTNQTELPSIIGCEFTKGHFVKGVE